MKNNLEYFQVIEPKEPTPADLARKARQRSNLFYTGMGFIAIAMVFLGFGQSFYGTATGARQVSFLVHLHSATFGVWLILFIVQTRLIARRNIKLHRQLGFAAIALAVIMIVTSFYTAIVAARNGYDLDGTNDPLRFMVFTVGNAVSLTILLAGGFWYRRRPEVHKRLMLLATVGPMMSAPLAHFFTQVPPFLNLPPIFLGMMAALLFSSAVYDRLTRGSFHPVSLWGAMLLFVWGNLLALVIGPSDVWRRFATWLTS
jgi:uncharacterized membrane protein YozB (DUF420 family)